LFFFFISINLFFFGLLWVFFFFFSKKITNSIAINSPESGAPQRVLRRSEQSHRRLAGASAGRIAEDLGPRLPHGDSAGLHPAADWYESTTTTTTTS
jgi:hypothetical protein